MQCSLIRDSRSAFLIDSTERGPRPQVTVYESLVFSARLRHRRETEQRVISAFVREVRGSDPGGHARGNNSITL